MAGWSRPVNERRSRSSSCPSSPTLLVGLNRTSRCCWADLEWKAWTGTPFTRPLYAPRWENAPSPPFRLSELIPFSIVVGTISAPPSHGDNCVDTATIAWTRPHVELAGLISQLGLLWTPPLAVLPPPPMVSCGGQDCGGSEAIHTSSHPSPCDRGSRRACVPVQGRVRMERGRFVGRGSGTCGGPV